MLTKVNDTSQIQTQSFQEGWKEWVLEKSQPRSDRRRRPFRIVDLFCGCGGMSCGAISEAIAIGYNPQIVFAADCSTVAMATYRHNFEPFIKEFSVDDLCLRFPSAGSTASYNSHEPIDLLLAGPPCQGHSNLNNSTRRSDPRNELYLSAVTGVEFFRPKVAIIENVPEVVHSEGEYTSVGAKRLRYVGYSVQEFFVDVSLIGLPQTRRRHILVATEATLPAVKILSEIQALSLRKYTLRDFIGDLERESTSELGIFNTPSNMRGENKRRVEYLFENQLFDLPDFMRPPCHREKEHSYKSVYGRLAWDRPAQTITSGFGSMGQGRYVHPSQKRTITPHEAARIQGFPDYFSFAPVVHRTPLQEMIANAVPPPLIKTLVSILFGRKDAKV